MICAARATLTRAVALGPRAPLPRERSQDRANDRKVCELGSHCESGPLYAVAAKHESVSRLIVRVNPMEIMLDFATNDA